MSKGDPSDKYLIEQYIAGDKSTLPILGSRWHKVFCQKAYWILKNKDLSKDVAQECWIIIIHKLHTLKNTESFKSWALRIVYTKAIDALKKHTKERHKLNEIEQNLNVESDASIDKSEIKTKLLKAIRDLSEDKQDIIRLFYVEEYSIKEIGAFLEIPIGTVKSRLFKAREKLKSSIKK